MTFSASVWFELQVKIELTPRLARLSTMLRPIPRLPPVTMAILFFEIASFSVGISSSLVGAVVIHCVGEEAVDIYLFIGVVDRKARVSATTRSANFGSRTSAEPSIGWPPSS
jgi:hypothetical protein